MTAIQNFDATNIPPAQASGKHPEGTFPFQITNTFGQENRAKDGGMLVVEFTSPAGRILNYYNLFNKSAQAVEIAQKELSALCHATGIFKLSFLNPDGSPMDYKDWARELRGGRGVMKVRPQTNNPEYMEVEKVFDSAGNEPGKSGGSAPQTQPQQGQQGQQSGWGNAGQQQPVNQQPPNNAGWGNQQGQAQPQTQQGGGQSWQPGPTQQQPQTSANGAPPWSRQ